MSVPVKLLAWCLMIPDTWIFLLLCILWLYTTFCMFLPFSPASVPHLFCSLLLLPPLMLPIITFLFPVPSFYLHHQMYVLILSAAGTAHTFVSPLSLHWNQWCWHQTWPWEAMVTLLAFLLHIWEVPCLNFGPEIEYPDRFFIHTWHGSMYLNFSYDHFLPYPILFVNCLSILCCSVTAADSIIN